MSDKNFRHFCKGEVTSPLILALGNGLGNPALTRLGQQLMSFIIEYLYIKMTSIA